MGGSSLIFGPEKGSEKVEIPVESLAVPVGGKPKKMAIELVELVGESSMMMTMKCCNG